MPAKGRQVTVRGRLARRPLRRSRGVTKAYVDKMIKGTIEPIEFDTAISDDTFFSGTSIVKHLSAYTGDKEQFLVHSLQLHAVLYNTVNSTQSCTFRLIIFKATDCNGALPAITDLLLTDSIVALRDFDHRTKYHVYMDKMITLRQSQLTANNDVVSKPVKKYIAFKKPLRVTGDGAIANATTNHLFMALMSNYPADANSPAILGNVRLIIRDA